MKDFKESVSVALDHLETMIIFEETPNSEELKRAKIEPTTPPSVPIKVEKRTPVKLPAGKHLIRLLKYFTFVHRPKCEGISLIKGGFS